MLADRLAELFDEFGLCLISATESTGPDTWRTTTVRDASILDESENALVTIIEEGGL
ncbi:hypothetical protein [Capillimicrobium parvum]|uniref:Uncharacterized protein n=1 Tax=Capillimicrobium parvum TaxID=2884022 RepID=A0A9E6XU62_9ACTN|nr:hypothetical protein [Capillimicrobium parvum]UGS34535.1 hypothetical protein DSM104329_00913 [Capillimicrobium parvum]